MCESPPPPTPPASKSVILHLAAGAVPPTVAVIVCLWQILEPFAAPQHRGMLYAWVLACLIFPMVVWIWCKEQDNRRHAKAAEEAASERERELLAELRRIGTAVAEHDQSVECRFVKLGRSMGGVHQHLDRHDEALAENKEAIAAAQGQVEHLRNLIMANDPPQFQNQRMGPRSLS